MYYEDIKVEMTKIESANVAGVGYNEKEQIFAIEMLNDSLYYYLDIPKTHFDEILKAPSAGSYLHRNVKGKYRYIRIR